jgi:hypothetical protein
MDYVGLPLLKSSLSKVDTGKDALLQQAITAASRQVDNTTGRRFWLGDTATSLVINSRDRVVCDTDGERLLVADIGASAGLVVELGRDPNWTTVTADVELEPDGALANGAPVTSLLLLGGIWKRGLRDRVRITAKWGWPAVPTEVVQATLIQAQRLYKRKDSPEGVAGSADWGVIRMSRVDPDVQNLIQHLILPGFA